MKKPRTKQRNVIRAPESDAADPLDWTPLFGAFQQAFEWALDVAAQLAHDYPEEVAAVERVRRFMRKRIAGIPAHVRVDDVLFTFGLLIGAIERDLGPLDAIGAADAVDALDAFDVFDALGSWFAPMPMRLPSAAELWDRTVPRHFHPAQRIGSSLRFASA